MKRGSSIGFILGIIFLLILVGFGDAVWGCDLNIFEKVYIRQTSKPKVVTDSFAVRDPSGAFTLIVKNGKCGHHSVRHNRPDHSWANYQIMSQGKG